MLHGVQAQQVGANLSAGGTVGGNLLVSGNLAVTGDASINLSAVVSNSTILDVTGTEAFLVRKNSDGGDVFTIDTTNSNVKLAATGKLYLDGGGNTYLYEVSADKVDLVVGGVTVLEVSEGGGGASDYVAIQAANKLYFDGGADTYIQESGADVLDIYVGGANMIKLTESSTDTVLITGDLTVGVDGTGHDVKLFGDTSGAYMLWDQSEDDLVLAGAAGIDLAGDIDVDGTANLDAVDIDGAVQIDATFTSGVDGQGYDTKFFGDTSGAYMMWDTSEDDLIFVGAAGIDLAGDLDVDGTTNLDNTDIDGTVNISGLTTVQTGIVPDAQDGAYLGTSSLQWSDLFLADAAVVAFGDDGEVTLTHVHNTGLLLTDDSGIGTTQLQFGDSGTYIYQKADGHLGLVGDTEIDISATTIDINGAVAMDGAITGGTNITISGELDAATLDISGNADIDGTLEADAITVNGSSLASVIQAQTVDLATSFTASANNSTDETVYPVFVDGATGTQGAETDTGLTYNPSTGVITSTQFTGAVTGNVTGNASGTAATVTSGTQASITTVANVTTVGALNAGSITSGFGAINNGSSAITTTGLISGGSLDIDDVLINGTTIGHTDDTDLMTVADGVLTVAGEVDATSLDVSGNADIDGITNLDNTDIDGTLVVDGSNISLDSTATLNIDNSNTSNGITIGTATSGVPISIGHATSETTVNDNLVVTGDLTVNGTNFVVNSTTMQVDDNMIELAHSPAGSEGNDVAVDGGGITLKSSDSDKTILWTNSSDQWHYNQGINITSGNLVVAGDIDLEGSIDVNGTANLDIVDIDGAVNMAADLTMGANILMADDTSIGISDSDERIEFDASGDISVLGANLGIGTAAPAGLIDLAGDGPYYIGNTSDDTTKSSPIVFRQYNSGSETEGFMGMMGYSNSTSVNDIYIGGGLGGYNGATNIYLRTQADTTTRNANDVLSLKSTGNVGIGTADPVAADGSATTLQLGNNLIMQNVVGTQTMFANNAHYDGGWKQVVDGVNAVAMRFGASGTINFHIASELSAGATLSTWDSTDIAFVMDANSRISLSNNDSGDQNTIFGYATGTSLDDGSNYNTFFGHQVSDATMADATYNTGIGHQALSALTNGTINTAVGSSAGIALTTGDENVFLGSAAGYATTDTNKSVMIGRMAGFADISEDGHVGIGYKALYALTSGARMTAIGYSALAAQQAGENNVMIGYNVAYQANNSGFINNVGVGTYVFDGVVDVNAVGNTAVGHAAMSETIVDAGDYNTAIGYTALNALTGGTENTAVGSQAGAALTTGTYNVLLGSNAGNDLTTGAQNVCIGYGTLDRATTTAEGNIAIGYAAMHGNFTTANVDNCVAIGKFAISDGTLTATASGSVGVGYNALGDLTSGAGNVAVGYLAASAITDSTGNVAIGHEALKSVTAADGYNVAIGHGVMDAGTGGYFNICIGKDTGSSFANVNVGTTVLIGHEAGDAINNTGASNTIAIGRSALGALTSGAGNIAIGYEAASSVVTGANNIVIGKEALDAADGAESDNIAIGTSALGNLNHDSAADNIAIGSYAGDGMGAFDHIRNTFIGHNAGGGTWANNVSHYNTGVGAYTLYGAMDGALGNSAFGYEAGTANTTGTYNTTLGYNAGKAITTGDNNTCIGYQSGITGSPGGNQTTGDNALFVCDENIIGANIQVDWTVASDKRDKTDVEELDLGLEFVNKLTPVTYKWDKRAKYIDKSDPDVDLNDVTTDGTHKEDWLDVGFLAQDVADIEASYDYKIADKRNLTTSLSGDGKQYGTQYSKFVPMLVKAIQELSAKVEELEAKLK